MSETSSRSRITKNSDTNLSSSIPLNISTSPNTDTSIDTTSVSETPQNLNIERSSSPNYPSTPPFPFSSPPVIPIPSSSSPILALSPLPANPPSVVPNADSLASLHFHKTTSAPVSVPNTVTAGSSTSSIDSAANFDIIMTDTFVRHHPIMSTQPVVAPSVAAPLDHRPRATNINELAVIPSPQTLNPIPGHSVLFRGNNGFYFIRLVDGVLRELSAPHLKAILRFATEIYLATTRPGYRILALEPHGTREVFDALNADPVQPRKLPSIAPDGTITPGNGRYPLYINYPSPEQVDRIGDMLDQFGGHFDPALMQSIVVRAAAQNMGMGNKHSFHGQGGSHFKKQRYF